MPPEMETWATGDHCWIADRPAVVVGIPDDARFLTLREFAGGQLSQPDDYLRRYVKPRRSHLLGTLDGKLIDILAPDPAHLSAPTVARGLAHTPRWRGQTWEFLSGAEHSVNVAEELRQRGRVDLAPAGLLHDGAEFILGDVPTPVKPIYSIAGEAYEVIEERVLRAIFKAAEVAWPTSEEWQVVLDADRQQRDPEHQRLRTTPEAAKAQPPLSPSAAFVLYLTYAEALTPNWPGASRPWPWPAPGEPE